jgi:uncharacterized membrane protein YbhN (UPF0104 family)
VLVRLAHVAVAVSLMVLVFAAIGTEDILRRVTSADPGWLLAAMAAAQAQILASALRWRLTASQLGADIPVRRAIGEYYLSGLINMTLPGGVVGDATRAVRSRAARGLEVAAQAVVIERLAGQVALAVFLILGLLLAGEPAARLAAIVVSVILVLLAFVTFGRLPLLPDRMIPLTIKRFAGALRKSWLDRRAAWRQIGLSAMVVTANIATFACAAAATGTVLTLSEALFAIPLILTAMLIPLSIAGWGYREGAAALIFPMIGFTAATGVGASIVFGVMILLANAPGFGVLLAQRRANAAPDQPGDPL